MLRMQPYKVELPKNADEVVQLLALHKSDAKVCAGGTDVLVNIKHGLHEPKVLVHLSNVEGLDRVKESGDFLELGALLTLHDLTEHELVLEHAPALAYAASLVAGPQLRRMGTLGGNLCLDTRCLYYNQTYFWRESLGFCLKKDGTHCHVVDSGKKCVAAASNDTATMLMALGAEVTLKSASGERKMPLEDFYVADGIKNTVLAEDEILTSVRVRKEGDNTLQGYAKLRHRNAIDYPLLSVALHMVLDDKVVKEAHLVVSALAARPKKVRTDFLLGKAFDDAALDELCTFARKVCTPMTNIADDPAWRKDMVAVYVRRAYENAFENAGL